MSPSREGPCGYGPLDTIEERRRRIESGQAEFISHAPGVEGFTTALWRQSHEITAADCRNMLIAAGFSHLMDTQGNPTTPLRPNP